MNSSYGKLCESVAKYTNTKISRFGGIKKEWLSPMLRSVDSLGDYDVFELNSKKRKVKDDKLAHVGSAVLQLSKMRLIGFIYFLEEMLQEGSYKVLYLGKQLINIYLFNLICILQIPTVSFWGCQGMPIYLKIQMIILKTYVSQPSIQSSNQKR